jgi:serine/threonine protein kinase
MLRCSDGKLRFCDFDSARPIDEDPEAWEGFCIEQYLAPNRDFFHTGAPPTPSDDICDLGVSIWELYTGKEAFIHEFNNIEELLKERRTVDLMEIEDQDVRELVKGFLRQGGALV